jgi:hypothetical protein
VPARLPVRSSVIAKYASLAISAAFVTSTFFTGHPLIRSLKIAFATSAA